MVLAIGVLWWGIFTALTALVPTDLRISLILLIAVRFALGAGEAVVYPATNQFVAQWIPIHERGKANGWISPVWGRCWSYASIDHRDHRPLWLAGFVFVQCRPGRVHGGGVVLDRP